ncbi:hypothetical protein [Streptomyces hirsutus]|uniref:hypothetical protein n=1 Tax=Streptomyces hirsutus TaxID=35620 RepID=UPI00366493CB
MPVIADELRCNPIQSRRWLHRFNPMGLQGLEDLGGQGRKRQITEAERSMILGLIKQVAPARLAVQADGEPATAEASGPLRPGSPGGRSRPARRLCSRPAAWMIPTGEGPLWLSAIRNAFSRRIVTWETSARADADLVLTTLEYALASRKVNPWHAHSPCRPQLSVHFHQAHNTLGAGKN